MFDHIVSYINFNLCFSRVDYYFDTWTLHSLKQNLYGNCRLVYMGILIILPQFEHVCILKGRLTVF
jgi:hypothetical protein